MMVSRSVSMCFNLWLLSLEHRYQRALLCSYVRLSYEAFLRWSQSLHLVIDWAISAWDSSDFVDFLSNLSFLLATFLLAESLIPFESVHSKCLAFGIMLSSSSSYFNRCPLQNLQTTFASSSAFSNSSASKWVVAACKRGWQCGCYCCGGSYRARSVSVIGPSFLVLQVDSLSPLWQLWRYSCHFWFFLSNHHSE